MHITLQCQGRGAGAGGPMLDVKGGGVGPGGLDWGTRGWEACTVRSSAS